MSCFRVYFFDVNGKELSANPLNGKTWLGHSGGIQRNGKFALLYRDSVRVANYASLREVHGEKKVTIEDFPGMDRVGVKVWYGPDSCEKFWLVKTDYFGG